TVKTARNQTATREFPACFKAYGDFHLTSRPTLGRNRNFCLFVAKKRKANYRLNTDPRNMVTGNGLTAGHVDRTMPLTVDSNTMPIAGQKVGLPVRIVVKLCGVVESQVPIGFEDEGGFHYGADMAGWFFTI